ncbi:S1C family serine protease [Nocardioides caricicola]|uniref:S1C family serine protease n=1 Tax=Nocardioides caricicola TaxID=634770 RepID=A0ABW0N646_9ACTN
MSQDDPRDGTEPTQPIAPQQPTTPPPSWAPPQAWGGYPPPPPTQQLPYAPYAAARPPAPRGRVSGWIWPVVCVLALVLGIAGGVAGAAVYERASDGDGFVGDGLAGVDTVSEAPLPVENGSVAEVARRLLPSTVQIVAEYEGQEAGASGSGFILDRQGHVITNNHVVEGADEDDGPIEIVDQDGNRYSATVVGRSPVYDLAVLFAPEARGMEPAALGASRSLLVGEEVVAIGSPLGLSSTVTAGIVSAKDRPVTTGDSSSESSYINAVQTDAAINPGNSGGPLVNLRGQVVGVNSAIATTGGGGITGEQSGNIGVGFAIPIEQVRVTADQILRTGEASYPVIGAKVRTGGRTDASGAEIDSVEPDTPAERSGLQKGDVITEIEGQRVTDGIALIVAIRTHQPGETVEFTVERDGEERTISVTLGEQVG